MKGLRMQRDELIVEVARELLLRCIEGVKNGEVPEGGGPTYEQMGTNICGDFWGREELALEVAEFAKVSDYFTDGVFTACMEADRATKQ